MFEDTGAWLTQIRVLAALAFLAVIATLAVVMLSAGAPVWTVLPVLVLTLAAGRAIRRVRIDDRPLLAGLAGWVRFVSGRAT